VYRRSTQNSFELRAAVIMGIGDSGDGAVPRGVAAIVAVAFALLLGSSGIAQGQQFPSKPIRLVVPYAPGGSMDLTARSLAAPLSSLLEQHVYVDNRTGAGGNVGTDHVARSAPDGYTVLMFGDTNVIAPALYSKLNHDPEKDFSPVTLLVTASHVLLAHPSVGISTLAELTDYVKRNPGKLSYATPGNGTAQHLGTEVLKMMAGNLSLQHVPYRGGGQAIADLVGGQVPLGMLGFAPSLQHIKAGKLRALVVTGRKREPLLPDVPTVAESGFSGFHTATWYGAVVPAGTPSNVITQLYHAFVKAVNTPTVREKLAGAGLEVTTSAGPEEFGKYIQDEISRWPPVVKAAGAKVD
jgi:tripartite-type tricarboxylate transporter receptor subunit TctC